MAADPCPVGWVRPGTARQRGRVGPRDKEHSQSFGNLAGTNSLEKGRNNADAAILPGRAPPSSCCVSLGVGARPSAP